MAGDAGRKQSPLWVSHDLGQALRMTERQIQLCSGLLRTETRDE